MWPLIGTLRTYTILYVLSMVAYVVVALHLAKKRGVRQRTAILLGLFYCVGMTVGAKLLYDLQEGIPFSELVHPAHYFEYGYWGGPLAFLGLALLWVALFSEDRSAHLDLAVLALPVPMILAKLACFANGCCYGVECQWYWGVTFPAVAVAPGDVSRHPTQLYEVLAVVVILIVLLRLDGRRWRGLLLLWFLLLYGAGRPLTEVWRADLDVRPSIGAVSTAQLVCLAGALSAGLLLIVCQAVRAKTPANPSIHGVPTRER